MFEQKYNFCVIISFKFSCKSCKLLRTDNKTKSLKTIQSAVADSQIDPKRFHDNNLNNLVNNLVNESIDFLWQELIKVCHTVLYELYN